MAYLIKVKTLEANKTPKMWKVETMRKKCRYHSKNAATMPLKRLKNLYKSLTQN